MPAQRDEPSAPSQAENDVFERIVVALRATGRLVPALRRGMSLPYGVRTELLPGRNIRKAVGRAYCPSRAASSAQKKPSACVAQER